MCGGEDKDSEGLRVKWERTTVDVILVAAVPATVGAGAAQGNRARSWRQDGRC